MGQNVDTSSGPEQGDVSLPTEALSLSNLFVHRGLCIIVQDMPSACRASSPDKGHALGEHGVMYSAGNDMPAEFLARVSMYALWLALTGPS